MYANFDGDFIGINPGIQINPGMPGSGFPGVATLNVDIV